MALTRPEIKTLALELEAAMPPIRRSEPGCGPMLSRATPQDLLLMSDAIQWLVERALSESDTADSRPTSQAVMAAYCLQGARHLTDQAMYALECGRRFEETIQ
ncbi:MULTISPECIES: hypothetical protein [unclassified Lysobacter]|uniref:hypothetical protein n=1 Tax=unclassified Lysobacter TaxID=2635362 RepID=UPI0006F915A4|nr:MULTISPECIES: hypothetical protein [unclassified Lysobacter]KRC34865.1 hypothetical protein ASE10_09255 [Lysobacter sp. Root76]KRD70554.1 hypothetical protein ASE45_01425 [Lysobacter sp. Root96]